MRTVISIMDLARMIYVSDRIESLRKVQESLESQVRLALPEGCTRVPTDAGTILVEITPNLVSVRYEKD